MEKVKPRTASQALSVLLKARQPAVLWGPPGIGKSQIVKQVCASENLDIRDIRAVLLDPVALRGLPYVVEGRSLWAAPGFLPDEGVGVLFFDELNRAPTLVQNACLQLVLDRCLGEYVLPSGWTVLAACNREQDGGGVQRMSSALLNRFVHLELEVDADQWSAWALAANIHPMVVAFLRFRPELLHKFDPQERAFPTPRSWEFVSGIVSQNPQKDILFALVGGAVGHGAAVEFMAFLDLYRKLPSIDAILLDPDNAPVPAEVSGLYAVSAALALRARSDNFSRILKYLARVSMEYGVFSVKSALGRDPSLATSPEFTRWAVANAAAL